MVNKETIKTWTEDRVGVIQLDRSKVLNALNRRMVTEILQTLEEWDRDDKISVMVVTGNDKLFAAGADIDEMAEDDSISLELLNQFAEWDRIAWVKKPIIAAVNGYCLGGAFELALSCDLIVAAEDAQFGFPEINLGVMPGAGGTVRLTKLMGRTKALEWLWLGEYMTAKTACENGVVNRTVAPELVFEETMKLARKIARQAPLSVRMIKETVNKSVDHSVYEAMQFERKNFYMLFSSEDQKEGMNAFVKKRKPRFKGK
ncbi:enoyl-CoA hydratase/isomerase family protein [Alkalihalobacillus sp. AL-G]|uniref:enoyl-CoA hydratase/isomerase family protein n=1 Tax=Alkalihalobacillus sp. AL-G TaxID=2926399 RepID=UPI00272C32D3|nr:enoyl-CoA hydratase-related protein [Alkalihalobacillus sp. AL-G]WLD94126.1 enoyl-CoA hydratase-related protein [Alkalihalobacillus sp. AL-G]